MPSNTRVDFMYRDASNNKFYRDFVVEGEHDHIESFFKPVLQDDEFVDIGKTSWGEIENFLGEDFMPGDDDHSWVSICGVEKTSDPAALTLDEFLSGFNISAEPEQEISLSSTVSPTP